MKPTIQVVVARFGGHSGRYEGCRKYREDSEYEIIERKDGILHLPSADLDGKDMMNGRGEVYVLPDR